ncbi:MAG: hypothetical protein ACOYKE_10340 [Ferruginibacter sp.]
MKQIIVLLYVIVPLALAAQSNKTNTRICGTEFSRFGLSGLSYSAALDAAGKMHNDYQEYVLRFLLKNKANFSDTVLLKKIIFEKTNEFFIQRGFTPDKRLYVLNLGKAYQPTFGMLPQQYSVEAYALLIELQNAVSSYSELNEVSFFNSLQSIRNRALSLKDDKEVFIVGIPVSIAIQSFQYWKTQGQYWIDQLTALPFKAMVVGETAERKPCKVKLLNAGVADAGGALTGASSGLVLGPGGALAGGVMAGATSSLGNITNQVISCHISWWPF